MSVATLNGNYYWSAPFTVPQNKTVIIDMEAGGLVDMYVLWNEQELTAFKNGQRPYHRAALGVRNYYNKINLASLGPPIIPPNALSSPSTPSLAGIALLSGLFGPPFPNSTWYLVIVNRSQTEPIPIFYRVYNA